MTCTPNVHDASAVPESRKPGGLAGAEAGDERKTSAVPGQRERRQGRLDAGPFTADVASFRLHLAAENKAPGTIRIYTEAPLWFAAAYLLREPEKSRWEQVDAQDVQRWVAWLVSGYSQAYASSPPVHRDMGEEPVLDLVPLRRPWLVPRGKWQTVISSPVSTARAASSAFQARVR
jgi:hypothetical protein